MTYSQTQLCCAIFFNYLVPLLDPWFLFPVSITTDAASAPCMSLEWSVLSLGPRQEGFGTHFLPFPFTSFSKQSRTWLKICFHPRLSLWPQPTSLNVFFLEGLDRQSLKCPSRALSYESDFTEILRFQGEQNFLLGHLITLALLISSLFLFCFVLLCSLTCGIFLYCKISTCLSLLRANALWWPYMYRPTYLYPHTLLTLPFSLDVSRYVLPHCDGKRWVI